MQSALLSYDLPSSMTYHIDIQNTLPNPLPVNEEELTLWATMVLEKHKTAAELTLRIVDAEEIQQLNAEYRQQNKATNVLAFPFSMPDGVELDCPLLGDVIICPEVLQIESVEQDKPLKAHWAHIIIHGILHLLGYDHMTEEESAVMQAEEITLLSKLGYANPYNIEDFDLEKK